MLKAHLWKERSIGEREEVKLELLNADGSPFELEAPEPEEAEDWIVVLDADMANGWTNIGGYDVKYRKRPDGVVELCGYADPGSGSARMFTLPVGYRPTHPGLGPHSFPVSTSSGVGNVEVGNTGQVIYASSITTETSVNLAPVRFSTD